MPIKITKKIVGYEVLSNKDKTKKNEPQLERMNEHVARPQHLIGSTYKIKTPLSPYSLYVTINDVILNEDTEHELRHPFEIFINSKNMDHFQWIVALTRVMSAVFRKGGDVTFLVEELRSVFDPRGGYLKKGGKYIPSLIAEIGDVIETHLINIGLIKKTEMNDAQKQYLAKKKKEYNSKNNIKEEETNSSNEFPEGAILCSKCNVTAMIQLDNCLTCLNCGESKCG